MRSRRFVVVAVAAVFALAGCSGGGAEDPAETPAAQAEAEISAEPRSVDPDAPENAVLADSDDMGHKMCELWTTSLEDEDDLRDVVEDVDWYGEQAKNDFMRSPVSTDDWGSGNPGHTDVLCHWNGYETEDGSPSDLLG